MLAHIIHSEWLPGMNKGPMREKQNELMAHKDRAKWCQSLRDVSRGQLSLLSIVTHFHSHAVESFYNSVPLDQPFRASYS